MELLLKLPRQGKVTEEARILIHQQRAIMEGDKVFRSVLLSLDVDPV
jgi:hypothetical protein